jgi:two-component system sensor histidine kinase PilS (NtrC family)
VEVLRRRPGLALVGTQAALDLLLTTAVVHVTGGAGSQFAPLYILVLAAAALLLPVAGGLVAAATATLLYAGDVLWLLPGGSTLGLTLQACVFLIVAAGAGYVGARLRQAGAGGERLAAALARARVEATDILRNIRSGIVTVDAQGRLLFANPAASALLQLDLAARLGRPVLDEVGRVAPVLADVLFRAAARRERTTRAEGSVRVGEVTALIGVTTTVSDGDGEGASGTAIFSDITQSKRLEALHLRAQRLEAVAELSASLAHEIKNPLASIRSATEQLAGLATRGVDGALEPRTPTTCGAVALTVRESDRLSRLLSEFLDFARARVTSVERVDRGRWPATRRALPPRTPPPRRCACPRRGPRRRAGARRRPELLHRALFNLALNAAQATADALPAGGGRGAAVEVRTPAGDRAGRARLSFPAPGRWRCTSPSARGGDPADALDRGSTRSSPRAWRVGLGSPSCSARSRRTAGWCSWGKPGGSKRRRALLPCCSRAAAAGAEPELPEGAPFIAHRSRSAQRAVA